MMERGRTYRTNADACPACKASLQGKQIPPHDQEAYGATHYSRKIGIYSQGRDRTVAWRCPDCGHEWKRG